MHNVLDIGNCSPDHAALRHLIETEFDAQVIQAHGYSDAPKVLEQDTISLILVNRKLDRDYSDGLDVIKQLQRDARYAEIPVMMITNYPDHQETAVAAGAVPGFGKLQLRSDKTREILATYLP